jgi:integrative and conjugative element protein (TIGR02256 family)
MVLSAIKRVFGPRLCVEEVSATLEDTNQSIRVERAALVHVYKYRQLSAKKLEAGGQIFGSVEGNIVRVTTATGPYPGDERSRYGYRSNPRNAQNEIASQAAAGHLYLGEWHTHAEDRPVPSGLDYDAMRRLVERSDLNTNMLLMLIVGRIANWSGLALLSISRSDARHWRLTRGA